MFTNYCLTAFRSLLRNKTFSIINILGLSAGVASMLLIALYVYHETSYDRYHENANRIYRLTTTLHTENGSVAQATASLPMGPVLADTYTQVEAYTRIMPWTVRIKQGNQTFREAEYAAADPSVFQVFGLKIIKGDARTPLAEPHSVVLSVSAARKYFGEKDPIGEMLTIDTAPSKVTAVMEDMPENSHMRFSMFSDLPIQTGKNKSYQQYDWYWGGFHTYVLLGSKEQADALSKALPSFIEKNIPKGEMYYESLTLQPLTEIYLAPSLAHETGKRGSLSNLYIMSAIAVVILVIACFNYINLATARATHRFKEVGLRKVMGAGRSTLVAQFLGESLMISALSTILGSQIAILVLPAFNTWLDITLSIDKLVSPLYIAIGLTALTLLIGVLAGAYPALVLSGFQPVQLFRNAFGSLLGRNTLQRVLVSAQFAISIALVAGTLLIFDQLSMLRNKELGYTKNGMLLLRYHNDLKSVQGHAEYIKSELCKIPGVQTSSFSYTTPGETSFNMPVSLELKDGSMSPANVNVLFADHDFLPTYNIKLIEGRNFAEHLPAADSAAFLINEAAAKDFGWTSRQAIGKKLTVSNRTGNVIGIVKNFHYESLHHTVTPLVIGEEPLIYQVLSLRIASANIPAVVSAVEKRWKEVTNNELPFSYTFLEQDIERLYTADRQLGKIGGLFGGLAILLCGIGLFGLAAYAVERRIKEIGIRKVLGASTRNIIILLSHESLRLFTIAFIVAVPLTIYIITPWLESFTYHITIHTTPFLISATTIITLAALTTSLLTYQAATTNPANTLRKD